MNWCHSIWLRENVVYAHTVVYSSENECFIWMALALALVLALPLPVCGFSNIRAVFHGVNDYFEFQSVAHMHIECRCGFDSISRAKAIHEKSQFLIAERMFFSWNVITLLWFECDKVCKRVRQNHICVFLIQRESKIHTFCRWFLHFTISPRIREIKSSPTWMEIVAFGAENAE